MRNRSNLPFALLFSLLCLPSLGAASEPYSQSAPASPSSKPAERALTANGVRPEDPAKRQEAAPAKAVQAESVEAAGGASTKRMLVIGAVVLAVAALAILIGMGGGGGSSGGGY